MTQKPADRRDFRLIQLDIIKAVGVIFMMVLHTVVWWFSDDYITNDKVLEFTFFLEVVGFFVFLIPITAGAAFYYYLIKNKYYGQRKNIGAVLKRSIVLLFLAYLTNIIAFGLEDILSWDVLHFFSLGFIILYAFSFFPIHYLAIFSFVSTVIAPLLRNILLDFNDSYWAIILVGNNTSYHYWAFFPWFALIGFGMVIADLYYKGLLKNKSLQKTLVLASLGAIAISFYLNELIFDSNIVSVWGPHIFMPPISRIFAIVGMFFLFFIILKKYPPKSTAKYGIVNAFSKGILWIYISHLIIGFNFINFLKQNNIYGMGYMLLTLFALIALSYLVGLAAVIWKEKVKLKLLKS